VTDYARWAVLNHPGREALIRSHTHGVVDPGKIPFDATTSSSSRCNHRHTSWPEGIVCLLRSRTCGRAIRRVSARPVAPTTTWFSITWMEAPAELNVIPQTIAFRTSGIQSPRDCCFEGVKRTQYGLIGGPSFLLRRTVCQTHGEEATDDAGKEALRMCSEVPIRSTGELFKSVYGVNDPPLWGNAHRYLKLPFKLQYYLAAGQLAGLGQGVADAASLGCICIGQKDKVYHRMICHPDCLSDSLVGMPKIVRRILNSAGMHEEILAWQDRALQEDFVRRPIAILEKAIQWKAKTRERVGRRPG